MKLKLVTIALLVGQLFVGRSALANDYLSSRETQILTNEVLRAYAEVPEAKHCVNNVREGYPEIALGFCYSWYKQALTEEQKAAANIYLTTAYERINDSINRSRE